MRLILLAVALAAAVPLRAQAPVITPKGDPSVKSDTIYKLAVNASDHPDDGVVYLLDDGVVRLETDGRGTRTYRQVIQVLREEDVEEYSERSFSYAPAHEKLTLNWARVLKPDGTVVSDGPSHVQDADVPAALGNPVYSDTKIKRISLSGLEPGMLVDISVTTEELKPYRAGDFLESWSVHMFAPVLRSRYILDLPASVTPHIMERNLLSPRTTRTVGGRTIYTWTAHDVPKLKFELFAADSNGIVASIMIGAPTTWSSIAQWYAGYAKDRYAASPRLTQEIRELVRGAKTRDDSIGRVQHWVAHDIRYVSLALGIGGYQPRLPDSVLATKFGDCKDKTTLFITALGTIGVTAYPVLLNSFGHTERMLPSYRQFNHVIAAVKRPGGQAGYQFTDLTQSLSAYGEPLSMFGGDFGVVVLPDGRGEEVTFPRDNAADNVDSTMVTGALDTAGIFRGRYEEHVRGRLVPRVRSMFETPPDSEQRAGIANAIARRYFEEAAGDSLVAFDGKDFSAPPVVRVTITRARAATTSGGTMILMLPPDGSAEFRRLAEQLQKEPARKYPIDATKVFGQQTSITELRMTLPEGWTTALPPSVDANSVFGHYSTTYAQTGRELRITRRVSGTEGVYPPARVTDLIAWLQAIARDDVKFVVLTRGTK